MLLRNVLYFIIALMGIEQVLAQSIPLPPRLQIEMMQHPKNFETDSSSSETPRFQDCLLLGIEMENDADWSLIEKLRAHINTRTGAFATIQLPKSLLGALVQVPGLKAIHYDPSSHPLNDKAIAHVYADQVHAGLAPLPQGYSGKDVVVGIIDTGIDYLHTDFRDPSDPNRSRIAYIWDQWADEGTRPEGFSYGVEWTREQIEKALLPPNDQTYLHLDTFPQGAGHGTHVSGTAAGNEGLAYEADIIVVATIFLEAGILDAAHYILRRADEMGKPCVINLSLGSNLHAHDGADFLSEGLSQLLDGTSGASIVASAGNEGHRLAHWGNFPLGEEPTSVYYAGGDGVEIYFRIPKSVLPTFELDIAVDTAKYDNGVFTSLAELGRTGWLKPAELGSHPFYQPFRYRNDSLAVDLYVVNFTTEEKDYAEIYIWLDEGWNLYNWVNHRNELELFRFYVRGAGTFHAWFSSVRLYTFTSPADVGRNEPGYKAADNNFNIFSPCDGRNILCVGAYTNRSNWIDLEGKNWSWPPAQATGDLANFSSHGPTMDNRIKPEIVAPGKVVASAVPRYNDYGIYLTKADPPQAVFSGTSMSAPVVTGVIALLLQANPALTHQEIHNLITSTAIADVQSMSKGPLPNGYWGYGKLNAYKAMLAALGITTTAYPSIETTSMSIFPNPARETINLVFLSGRKSPGELRIRDFSGREVFPRLPIDISGISKLEVGSLPKGIYLVEWTDGRQRIVEKLILQ